MYQRWSGRSESQIATQLNPQFDLRLSPSASIRNFPQTQIPPIGEALVEEQYSAAPVLPDADHFGSPNGVGKSPLSQTDRCALLLDPSMMEQARRAAAEFEAENQARRSPHVSLQLGRQVSTRKKPARKPALSLRPAKSRGANRPRRPANSRKAGRAKANKRQRAQKQKTASQNRRRKKPSRAPKQKSRPFNRRKRKP